MELVGNKIVDLDQTYGQTELVYNQNKYTTLTVLENVLIKLPKPEGIRYQPKYVEVKAEDGFVIQPNEHYNVSNIRQQLHHQHTIAKNIYSQVNANSDPIFSVRDKGKCPLGRFVNAKVEVQLKCGFNKKIGKMVKSIIVNIFVYDDQTRAPKWFYKETVGAASSSAKTFHVPNDVMRIIFEPYEPAKH